MIRIGKRVIRKNYCTAAIVDDHVQLPVTSIGQHYRPKQVVDQLNAFIVGQANAKRAVAIALRNRWRRQNVVEDLKNEISPKNILMLGPTGTGKTEIARRLAILSQAPFVKVEATKFTEVGYHGRDVDSIIRDLVENAIQMVKKERSKMAKMGIAERVENRILDVLVGEKASEKTRSTFQDLLRSGDLEDRRIRVQVPERSLDAGEESPVRGGVVLAGMEGKKFKSLEKVLEGLSTNFNEQRVKTMSVGESRPIFEELELENALDTKHVVEEAIRQTEENGIVFIDEIDKVVSTGEARGGDASSEGVQRDLLPIIEGSSVSTKHGNVNTDHILFIASGAFHSCKPSNLLAELQGRLPIRVELQALTEKDLYAILTEPVNNVLRQQTELLKTEGIQLEFTQDGIREIAKVAHESNRTVENIGARRLHTIVERVVEDISFDASDMEKGTMIQVDAKLVREKVAPLLTKSDLSKFIL